jgi:cobalamin biosynthesis Mg chelatase CobN
MECCSPQPEGVKSSAVFQLNFGFGSFGAKAPQVEVVVDESPTIPVSVEQVKLPEAQLSVAGSASASLAEGVDSMVCDASCIEGLFASAGFEDGTMSISAGGESVVVYKGQKKALISIGKNASAITARAVSADGSKTATLSMKLDRADAALEKAMQEKVATGAFQSASESETSTSSSTSGSSKSMYIYVLIALVILMAIGYMRRKKATPAN